MLRFAGFDPDDVLLELSNPQPGLFYQAKPLFAKRLMMTSRHQNYLGYSYPAQLAELIKRESRIQAIEALPKDAHLGRLLEVAYHATLLREEQRPVSFRLLFARPEDLPPRRPDALPPTHSTK